MIKRLTNFDSTKNAEQRIKELIEPHGEWLCVRGVRATVLRNSECDFRVEHGRLIFSCLADEGALSWRVNGWEWTGEKLLLETSRSMGAEKGQIELVPRASIKAMTALVSATRRERCRQLAELACAFVKGARVERASLSAGSSPGQPGAFARIILLGKNERIAVAALVAESVGRNIDAFLSSTLIWFARACERARPPFIKRLWLIVENDLAESLSQRLALLRDGLRRITSLYQIDNESRELTRTELPELAELLTKKRGRLRRPAGRSLRSESE